MSMFKTLLCAYINSLALHASTSIYSLEAMLDENVENVNTSSERNVRAVSAFASSDLFTIDKINLDRFVAFFL